MTAMNEPAYLGEKTPFMNLATVKAVIRKDMRTLWPLATAVAGMTLLASVFTHEPPFSDLTIRFGRDVSIEVGQLLWGLIFIITLVGAVLFVVMLAQQDRATDARNDWMARPIKAGELVLAKAMTLAAMVLAPMALGVVIAVMTGKLGGDVAIYNWVFAVMACAMFLTIGWLCSGTIQAILATVGVVILTLLMTTVSVGVTEMRQSIAADRAIAVPIERTVRVPAPPRAMPAPPEFVPVGPMERPANVRSSNEGWMEGLPILAGLFVGAIGGVGVTLWLLLGRRQVLPARLTFASLYALGVLVFTQSVAKVDVALSIPAATLEQRIASFTKNDANGDGKLDKPEYQNVINELGYPDELDNFWAQRDRDGDGVLSLEEIKPEIGLTPPAASLEERMKAFTTYDADHDNKLTKDEYALAMRSLGFGGLVETYWPLRDLDKDGFITIVEYVPAVQAPPIQTKQIPAPTPPQRF
jgi:Ca2+-binding EF-hand superfamily protein